METLDKKLFDETLRKHSLSDSGTGLSLPGVRIDYVQKTDLSITSADFTGSILFNCAFWRCDFSNSCFDRTQMDTSKNLSLLA
jgi:uncharacterized protein YjbI with pentapeptide repeats